MKRHFIHPLCLTLLLIPTAVWADYRDDVGYRALEDEHQLLSRGANLRIGQVEAQIDHAYMPDRTALEFLGKHIFPLALLNTSDHATMVGRMIYGENGLAPDTAYINVYDSTSFLIGSKKHDPGLHVGQRLPPVKLNGVSVLNNSWIAAFNSDAQNIDAIRRLDFMIDRDDMVVVSSVDNGADSAFPKLLATNYNGITVGLMGGNGSSSGPIRFDSRGTRVKPDLTVPWEGGGVDTTSEAAAVVSGAAALIRSEAKARHINVGELTTKALLMAGANRPDDWQRGAAGSYDDEKVPLDYRYGAGSLRVDNSFDILLSGQHSQGGRETGWDASMAKKKNHTYGFRIAETPDTLDDDDIDFTAVLTWNRDIKRSMRGKFSSSMADLEMSLWTRSGTHWTRLSRSDSDFDNVETITLSDLAPGAYKLVVRGDRPEPYSLAWFTSHEAHHDGGGGSNSGPGGGELQLLQTTVSLGGLTLTAVPEPALLGLLIPIAATMLLRRKRAIQLQ